MQTTIHKKLVHRQFYQYVIPSMITMLLSGFYAIIDGLFVGNAVGNDGLAAINLVYPIQVILNATAIGIGIGAAVIFSKCKGENDENGMSHALASSITLLLLSGIILPLILMVLLPISLQALGTTSELYPHAYAYITVILLGGIFPILGNGLNPMLRNQGKPFLATLFMCSGLITNILLDYLFVFRFSMGLKGAALATITAQGVVALCSFVYLWKYQLKHIHKHHFKPSFSFIKQMILIGLSPFGQTLAPSVMIIITNWMCLRYGGNDAVTIYSVVSYVMASAQLLLQGIGDGVQPLISFYYGAQRQEEVQYLYRKSFFMTLATGIGLTIAVWIWKEPLTLLFGISESLIVPASLAICITALSYPFLGITRLTSAIFYASNRTKYSSLLVYIQPCLVLPICLVVLSSILQVNGIWIAYPIAEIIISMIALILQSPNTQGIKITQKQASQCS